jgi:hypothetical protein
VSVARDVVDELEEARDFLVGRLRMLRRMALREKLEVDAEDIMMIVSWEVDGRWLEKLINIPVVCAVMGMY